MVMPESVKQLLASDDYGTRLRAVNQIRQLEPEIAFEMLQIAARDTHARVRYAAISQFASLGHQDATRTLEILRFGLRDPEPDVQAVAADSLAALKLTVAFDELQDLYYNTSEWVVQLSIIAALGEMGEPRAFELLEAALASPTDLIRTSAIGALGELGDRRAITPVAGLAQDDDWQVRHRVAQALGNLGSDDPGAIATLDRLSQDKSEQVAQAAQASLAALRS